MNTPSSTTCPPLLVPLGHGSVVRLVVTPSQSFWQCVLWFHETACLRNLDRDTAPSREDLIDDLNAHPGLWVCIGQNR
ncbi:MAG: hypothetical protein H2172_12530 [Opitutus sp.]|nr:hypothetical protein [Opitutus sp.]MCS6248694.1 hypothetical protein [Opitutus sp.]MCS6275562.1 hypothetical protein [Opitutus sp.]MCS6301004.1 hypothetical protein [Opitutus sp.]